VVAANTMVGRHLIGRHRIMSYLATVRRPLGISERVQKPFKHEIGGSLFATADLTT
jgi:hypothetical protein